MDEDGVIAPFQPPSPVNRRPLASARFVPQDLLDRQGYSRGDFWLGRTLRGRPFGWTEEMNLLTCAGPGAGKGVSTVIPNLLEFPGSAVIVDPKGELAALTAAYRRDVLGQKVIVLDPAGVANVAPELRGTYNPLAELDPSDPHVVAAAQVIASGIVVPNPKAKEPFWDDVAVDFIQSCILYMAQEYPPPQRTLMKLRETASVGDKTLFDAWVKKKQDKDPDFIPDPGDSFDLFVRAMHQTKEFGGVVSETAAKLAQMGDQTRGNALGTARTHLDFLKEPKLWGVLEPNIDATRTFKLKELRRQDKPLTVYLCLPVDMIPRQGRWFRLIVSQIIQSIERSTFDKGRDLPILMMIDEFFQLGPLPSITNTLTYARSFGLRLWLIVQDLNQLKMNYPESWETILGACGIKQFFGVNDLFTARYVSELIGEEEIDVPSVSLTKTYSDTESTNGSETTGEGLTQTLGMNWSRANGQSQSTATSDGTSATTGLTSGTSATRTLGHGTSEGEGTGSNDGTSIGADGKTGSNQGRSGSRNQGSNQSASDALGSSTSSSTSGGRSNSISVTAGASVTNTLGGSSSTAESRNRSTSAGWGASVSTGTNYAYTVSKQTRRRLRAEDVLLSFTKDNMVQLTHIRDQGGMLLFRTPYYADPYFRWLLTNDKQDE